MTLALAAAKCPKCGAVLKEDFEIRAGRLIRYNGAATDVVIPDGVKGIGGKAFADCKYLTSVIIPGSVTSIENSIFKDCKSLTSVTIPDSVKEIGDYAFYGCTGISDIKISSNNWKKFKNSFDFTPYYKNHQND